MPPVITDPFFYAIAAPAVLMLGLAKSGFGSGLGSLAVPLMAMVVPVPDAAAILMPVLLVMDLLGLAAFRRHVDFALLKFMLPYGLVGVLVGLGSFRLLDAHTVAGLVGLCTLLFLAQRLIFPPRPDAPPPRKVVGAVLMGLGGFTSFISHSGGPPVTAYTLPLRLSPLVFTGTMAYFFFAINLAKWEPYAWLGLLEVRNIATSFVLLPLAPLGVWTGIHIARRMQPVWFYRFVTLGMALTGLKLTWDGWFSG